MNPLHSKDISPLMRQFQEIKQGYPDSILFFRVGDFYEMFFEDAHTASGLLNIALTSRDKNSPNPVPLCGVPHHSAMSYIAKLLQAGQTVALCEQVEDPKEAKGLVRREVVRLYTPGTLFDPELLQANQSNFLTALWVTPLPHSPENQMGVASVDLSTGEFFMNEFSGEHCREDTLDEIIKICPQELLYPQELPAVFPDFHSLLIRLKLPRLVPVDSSTRDRQAAIDSFLKQFHETRLEHLGLQDLHAGLHAGGAILWYLHNTQPTLTHHHLQRPLIRQVQQEMPLDRMSIRNLELVDPLPENDSDTTLFSVLNHTVTSMGSRLLRQWVLRPLVNITAIQERLQAVSELTSNSEIASKLRLHLKPVQDLERLGSRIALGSAHPRELLALQHSITNLSEIHTLLLGLHSKIVLQLVQSWDNLSDLSSLIGKAIRPDAPSSLRENGIIQEGFDPQLDALRSSAGQSTKLLAELETHERTRTGIDSLKIKYNQVFGYFFEVTKTHLGRVPEDFVRKQTLVNAERFTSESLKALEGEVLGSTQRLQELEKHLYATVRTTVAQGTSRIQKMAKRLAILDVLLALATAATTNRYVRPALHEGGNISIKEGRHPVLEKLNTDGGFIANDTHLDLDSQRLLLVTGPNMAGKSTYLRQIGVIVLMAQIGSFVPATEASIGLVDRIFTRVGASDNLSKGLSTFMVEMTETARILKFATSKSLILLDEVGRGTSTYDGLSIAWALAEFIQDRNLLGARTLFATHYHEMTELATMREGIKNLTISIKEEGDNILFLRKIIEGKVDKSYGIQVARLAGLPGTLIQRAQEVLGQLENSEEGKESQPTIANDRRDTSGLPSPHPIIEEVRQMDLFNMSPIEALNRLADFKQRLD